MEIYNDNKIINLSSKNAILNNGSFLSDVNFKFTGLYRKDESILESHISIINAQIPISFYNINIYNNILKLYINDISGTVYTLTLTRGNYNANNLISEITTQLINAGISDITISISSITGLLTFTKTTGSLTILSSISTISKVLGFDPLIESYTSTAQILSAPYPLNLLGTLKIRILSFDLLTNNVDSSVQGNLNLLSTIAIEAGTYGLILYDNFNNVQAILQNDNLDGFDMKLIDDDGNLINFNGADWSITLLLSMTKRRNNSGLETTFKQIVTPILQDINLLTDAISQTNLNTNETNTQPDQNINALDGQQDSQPVENTTQDNFVVPQENYNPDSDLSLLLYNHQIQ